VHVLSHEWVHQLKADHPDLYQMLEDEVRRQGKLGAYADDLERQAGDASARDDALEELTADATGDAMADPKFLDRMAKENPGVFSRIAQAFKDYLATFLGKRKDLGSNEYMTDVAKFHDVVADVLNKHAERRGLSERGEAPPEPAFARQRLEDRASSPEDVGGFGRGGEVDDNPRYQGGARAGQYIGAPAKYNTPAKIPALRRLFLQLSKEGEAGKRWYEDSGRAILEHTGSIEEARKLAKVLAIYSPQAKVDANTTMALHAWEQYKAGQPIQTKTAVQDRYAHRVLYGDGVFEGGEKTNNFYNNLMRHVDPQAHAKQGATIDLWMMRAAGYHTDSPTDAAYRFVENEVNRTARALGWSPEEVQAAIWVAMKARTENTGVKQRTEAESTKKGFMHYEENAKGKKVRVVDDEEAHRNTWLKHAMAHEVTPEDTGSASYHFGTALSERAAQLSHEAIPSVESGVLPGIHDAPMEQKVEYHRAIQDALRGDDGRDLIDKEVGPFGGRGQEGFSGWEGKSTVGTQQRVPVYTKEGRVNEASRRLIELNQAIRGHLLNQKAMAWHYPIYKGPGFAQNGAEVHLGRPLTEPENAALYQELTAQLGHSFAPPIPTPDGFRVLNFPDIQSEGEGRTKQAVQGDTRKANEAFHSAVQTAISKQPWDALNYTRFQSDGNLISSETEHGAASYRNRIASEAGALEATRPRSWGGRSDIQDWIEQDLRPRVAAVNRDFAERYGWGSPEGEVAPPKPAFSRARSEEVVSPHEDLRGDGPSQKMVKSPIGVLHVETAKGQTRTGTGDNGKPFSRTMKHDYGYIENVPGRDGGSMDVLLGEQPHNPMLPVFVVHQENQSGGFDEHKVLVGFKNQRDAERAYLSEYPKGWDRIGKIDQFTPATFKQWAQTQGREEAQLGKVDPGVPRANIRGQQPDAVSAHVFTDSPMPLKTANEGGRLNLPNATKGIATRTVLGPGGGKYETVLRNLYDVGADPRSLFDVARDTLEAHGLPADEPHMMNEFERLVVAHGYDGYRTSDGQATVLGAKVPMRATKEVGGEPVTANARTAPRREPEVAAENVRADNAPASEGENTPRAGRAESDDQAGQDDTSGARLRVPDESQGPSAHQGGVADTAIRNAATEALGAGPIERIGGKNADELVSGARGALKRSPNIGRDLAAAVARKPRNISDHESAVLALDRQRIIAEHAEATRRVVAAMDAKDDDAVANARAAMKFHEAELQTNREATVHAGTEWSKSGLARRLMVDPDESFATLLDRRKAAAGRELTDTERADVKKNADERTRLKKQIETPGLKDKPEMVQAAARKKFDDALAKLKAIPRDEIMTKECFI
jgi:hypothetical protein